MALTLAFANGPQGNVEFGDIENLSENLSKGLSLTVAITYPASGLQGFNGIYSVQPTAFQLLDRELRATSAEHLNPFQNRFSQDATLLTYTLFVSTLGTLDEIITNAAGTIIQRERLRVAMSWYVG